MNVSPGGTPTAWLVERRNSALVATLNRPAVRNALNFAAWEELERLIDIVDDDTEVRALILAGSGTIFSAGGDMKNVEGRGGTLMRDAARLKYLQTVLQRLARASVPTLAAVEGPAIGVAWGLAMTCDFIVAGRNATFVAPFVERSLVPDGGLAWHLVRAVGRLRAAEILLNSRTLSAEEAAGYGLVSEVVNAGGALARAEAIAERLASASRDTTQLTLRALRRAEQAGYRDYLDTELELAALNLHNPEVAAARLSYKKPAGGGEK
jgi:2-(1,2-epoxy-1,2-dihydrophenyl)acetyl-CoA isomerase